MISPATSESAPPRILESQCAWQAEDVSDEATWTEVFEAEELEEIDVALRVALDRSSDVLEIGSEDFPLPGLSKRLGRIESDLIEGRGFVRLRGIDRARYDQSEMEVIYWGLGMHLGQPWPQNKYGHVLGDVTDQGKAADDPTVRGNEIGGAALPYHCDGSDLVGLLCLQNGIDGGLSSVANSVSIHNTLVDEAPELAAELYLPQPFDFRGEQGKGGKPYYLVPIFTEWADRLFVRCIPPYIVASQRHEASPRLTDRAKTALTRVVELADDPAFHVHMELQPGDIQFINNYHVMHGRTAYTDNRQVGQIRHLKRLWLETSVLADRPPHFATPAFTHWENKRSASRMHVNG
jgi:hypothetical protein